MILFFGPVRFELKPKRQNVAASSSSTIITTIRAACEKYWTAKAFIFYTDDYKKTKKTILKSFRLIKAAGGVLYQDGQVLFIYRRGVWDLPKGKLEKGEGKRSGARREVEEECNVIGKIDKKLKSSYHFYWLGRNLVLKKTYWYRMQCANFEDAKPQTEEDIEEICIIPKDEVVDKLYPNMYPNIQLVFQRFLDSF